MKFYEQPENWAVAPGAIDAFRRLRSREIKVVVTSNWDDRLPNILEKLNITDEVDAVVASAIGGFEKPHQLVQTLLSRHRLPTKKTLKTSSTLAIQTSTTFTAPKTSASAIKWAAIERTSHCPAFDFQELADENDRVFLCLWRRSKYSAVLLKVVALARVGVYLYMHIYVVVVVVVLQRCCCLTVTYYS